MITQAQIDPPLPSCTNDCATLTIRRIEMFVIPDYGAYCSGYRVCLQLATNHGLGWGELFVNEADKPVDWIRWGSLLHRCIGEFPAGWLTGMNMTEKPRDNRIYNLFNDAVHHVGFEKLKPTNNGDLLVSSVSYISLF